MSAANQKVLARVGHMLEAIRHANSDIEGMLLEQFLDDGKSQRAVNDSIIVIGEAANRQEQLTRAGRPPDRLFGWAIRLLKDWFQAGSVAKPCNCAG